MLVSPCFARFLVDGVKVIYPIQILVKNSGARADRNEPVRRITYPTCGLVKRVERAKELTHDT